MRGTSVVEEEEGKEEERDTTQSTSNDGRVKQSPHHRLTTSRFRVVVTFHLYHEANVQSSNVQSSLDRTVATTVVVVMDYSIGREVCTSDAIG
jgi:hypothetical protein